MEQQHSEKRNWKITGSAKSTGGVFNKVTILGEAQVNGDLECEHLKVMGTLSVRGRLKLGTSKIMGTLTVTDNVEGDDVNVLGELTVKGDCNAEVFRSRGAFDIDGMLNAGEMEISLYGPARAREIGGSTIRVKPHFKLFSPGMRELTADTIEGDEIHLLNTSARVVRGSKVEIGPGCDVEIVEYKEDFKQDREAKVAKQIKI